MTRFVDIVRGFAFVLASACLLPGPLHAQEYLLDSDDVVGITVIESPDLSGEYRISADGSISLPGIGVITARGMTIRAFEAELARRAAMTIVEPSVSAQVLDYRPIYVLGDVSEPGQFTFRPRMTVLQAAAMAGGFGNQLDGNELSARLARLEAERVLERLEAELAEREVELTRVEAELAGSAEFAIDMSSPALAGLSESDLDQLVAKERRLFDTRRAAYEERREKITASLIANQNATESYEEAILTQEELMAQVQSQLLELRDLRERGIVSMDRLNALVQSEIGARAQVLQTATLKRQSEVAVADTEKQLADLETGYVEGLASQARGARASIALIETQIAGQLQSLSEIGGGSARSLYDGRAQFSIVAAGGASREVTMDAQILPGETLIVILPDTEDR